MDQEVLRSIVRSASETLQVEKKSWLNLELADDRAKIARALLALRNRNGGQLVFGVDDRTLVPLTDGRPNNVRIAYHADKIQELVKAFGRPPFPVEVEFVVVENAEHPVLVVPPGVRFPVICKQKHPQSATAGDALILRENAVYVRSVNNGRVESIEPRSPEDWNELIEICFDNREADVGRFLRRHLGSMIGELGLAPVGIQQPTPAPTIPATPPDSPPLAGPPASRQVSRSPMVVLIEGAKRFEVRLGELRSRYHISYVPKYPAWRECAIVFEGQVKPLVGQHLLEAVFPRHPHLSGWPLWIDSRSLGLDSGKPYPRDMGWEASILMENEAFATHPLLDFWRIDPRGEFYHRRSLEDDLWPRIPNEDRGVTFDIINGIKRVAEALATVQAIAPGILLNPDAATMRAAFRWTNLRGRRLVAIGSGRDFWAPTAANDDVAVSEVELPVATAREALATYVSKTVMPLFATFGYQVPERAIEELTNETLSKAWR
jgi:hypothetical protein